MNKPEKKCPITLNLEKRFQCDGCSQEFNCESRRYNETCLEIIEKIYNSLPTEEEIVKIVEQWYDNPTGINSKDLSYFIHDYNTLAKTIYRRLQNEMV